MTKCVVMPEKGWNATYRGDSFLPDKKKGLQFRLEIHLPDSFEEQISLRQAVYFLLVLKNWWREKSHPSFILDSTLFFWFAAGKQCSTEKIVYPLILNQHSNFNYIYPFKDNLFAFWIPTQKWVSVINFFQGWTMPTFSL